MPKNWVSAKEIFARVFEPNLRIIDVRSNLLDHSYGATKFAEGHLPNAVRLDLEKDLSGPKGEHGGRHPYPSADQIKAVFERVGVSDHTRVVVYDDAGGMYAARVWWLLKSIGHEDVCLLDGGIQAWLAEGFSLETAARSFPEGQITVQEKPELLASMEEVRTVKGRKDVLLIDARAPERYRGEVEPMDRIPGHIPGAINRPFGQNLENGKFKSLDALQAQYQDLTGAQEKILYCGSGVSAAHNAVVFDELGIPHRLYAGSYSDWVSYPEHEVETGEKATESVLTGE
ncbi:sulfurtransferase [Deinococcus roseus]|uniref:Thiosulfate sulfurtransferase n=1 Tax=Deinococcus roseus TaxID=392414 RepID=A0ABQ2CVM2_9DEIO|nr:sulfurtransferase [Deinococcus roseus]GGJ25196.1 thiosulfate sulfurtransferase [Deinococcus roseus]